MPFIPRSIEFYIHNIYNLLIIFRYIIALVYKNEIKKYRTK